MFCTNLHLEQISAFSNLRQCGAYCSADSLSNLVLSTFYCSQLEELQTGCHTGKNRRAMEARIYEEPTIMFEDTKQTSFFLPRKLNLQNL